MEQSKAKPTGDHDHADKSGTETEAKKKGGEEPAKRQAERDWQESAKDTGD